MTVDDVPKAIKLPEPVVRKPDSKSSAPSSATSSSSASTSTSATSSSSSDSAKSQKSITASGETKPAAPKAPAGPNVDNVRHDWYQSPTGVDISLFIKNVPKDKVKVDFGENSVSVSFPLATGSEFVYDFDPLFGTIDQKKSTFRVFGTKIEINLVKELEGKWDTLLEEGADNSENQTTKLTTEEAQKGLGIPSTPLAYPTSSKSGPKNWDAIAKGDELKDIEKIEQENDPNAFFRILYANADPDTQRAMLKSYTESNGTALSTNWEEVSKKKMETSPPEGMVAKTWAK